MNTDEWSRKLEEIPLIDLPPAGPDPFGEQRGTRPRRRPGAISGSRVFLGQHIHEAASEGSWMQTSSFPTIAIRSQPSRSCRFAIRCRTLLHAPVIGSPAPTRTRD